MNGNGQCHAVTPAPTVQTMTDAELISAAHDWLVDIGMPDKALPRDAYPRIVGRKYPGGWRAFAEEIGGTVVVIGGRS